MNLTVIAVDKLRERYAREACAIYADKLAPYLPMSVIEIKPQMLAAEGSAMLARIDSESLVWALDREGEMPSSIGLARRLAAAEHSGRRRLSLLIGGAKGLHADCVARADFRWSLSPLTFLHEMARLIALEQLFRCVKINRNEPYHR
jgi:23S rRNA (pseudouridine1915-N3)-methyltransferase